SGWDTKLQGTQFETTLGGATIRAGVGEQARADAKIILEGIKTTIHNETVSSSKSTLWQKQAGRGSNIETLQLPSFTGPVAPVLSAPGGYIVDIPKGNLKTQIETLTKQPEYAYLKQLQTVKDVNWNQVQLAYDKWDYKQEGLTGAGAAIIALAVTVVTSGAGTGAVLGLNGAAAAATDAAFASLASQASVSFINNKGDVGKTLKELGRSSTVKNLVVAASKGDVNAAANAAAVAVESNALSKERMDKLTKCLSGKTCSTTMEKVNAIKKDEQFSKVIDTEIQKVCSRNPLGDGCRNGINMSIKYIAMPAAWKYMPTDVSRVAKEVFGYLYNSQGASTRFDKYFNTIDNRADFFAASNLYEQNLGSKARWFGGADFVSRAAITGLGADGEASYITFAAGKVVGNPPIYEWRAASGNALIVNGFYNFRDLFNKKTNPREWDIQQLKSEQKLLQPIHQKYLSNEKDYLSLIKGVTSNKIFSIIPNPLDERKKIEDGINMLDYKSRIKYGCKLMG
ncbi:TPA: DUF637 domain-containing protein, partial [Neisseria meningitidis]